LRRFEQMKPGLERHRVTVVALSKDTVEQAARQRQRDGLSFPLLSDARLDVIKQYGVEHHKALEFSKGGFTLFGIPLALVPSVKKMAIPTTLLVDESGVIRWIDQADDYRLRSNEQRVMAAVERAFG
jgi:peroxiredoxin